MHRLPQKHYFGTKRHGIAVEIKDKTFFFISVKSRSDCFNLHDLLIGYSTKKLEIFTTTFSVTMNKLTSKVTKSYF